MIRTKPTTQRFCIIAIIIFAVYNFYVSISFIQEDSSTDSVGFFEHTIWTIQKWRILVDFIRAYARVWVDSLPEKWEHEIINYDTQNCNDYGWVKRAKVKLYDALIISNEIEMLDIRMHELDSIVDYFVIMESPVTFMGEKKELEFKKNRWKFKKFEKKICYHLVTGLDKPMDKWEREYEQRKAVKIALENCHVEQGDLIIMADLDEIPRNSVASLVKSCAGSYKQPLNLALRNYLYSFEWEDTAYYPNPKLAVWTWNNSDPIFSEHFPSRRVRGDTLFHDAGWHCSWCFKYISDFQWKMKAYSHSNEFARLEQHTPHYIQKTICSGNRLEGPYFTNIPVTTYETLFSILKPISSVKSMVNLPDYVVKNGREFNYLLPGGCKRELLRKHIAEKHEDTQEND